LYLTRKGICWGGGEYFKSPFVLMGICLLIIETLSDYFIAAEQFITLFWADQFHIVFLLPAVYLAREFSLSKYRSAMRLITFRKKNRSHVILIVNILSMILYSEILFAFLEVLLIMTGQHEEIIPNKEFFVISALVVKFIIFVGIPAVAISMQFSIKNMLIKDGIYLIDKIEYEKILTRAWMGFIIILILVEFFSFATPKNYYLESLNSVTNFLKPFTDIWRNIF